MLCADVISDTLLGGGGGGLGGHVGARWLAKNALKWDLRIARASSRNVCKMSSYCLQVGPKRTSSTLYF